MEDDGFSVNSVEDTNTFGFRKTRGKYVKHETVLWDFENNKVPDDDFKILDIAATDEEFAFVAPEVFDSLPVTGRRVDKERKASNANRLICFIDGEGSNSGEPTVKLRTEHKLKRSIQVQYYSLLACTFEGCTCEMDCHDCEYYHAIIGNNNCEQISSKRCLNFILSIPKTHIIVGYGLGYDVEHWLKDLPPNKMLELLKNQSVWWRGFRIHYIPSKLFSVSKYRKKEFLGSQTVYDIVGFFQGPFVEAIHKWNVGIQVEYDFIEQMKKLRPNFGPINTETLKYNHMEGKHGIRLFQRVREEYTKLQLSVPRPVGAGAIASAMFRKNRVDDYSPAFQPLPQEVMRQGYIGGRFDVARIGFFPFAYEYDINSAYPHIARNLPCLAHGRFEWTNQYERGPHSLWLVRWRNLEDRWSPFPYRTDGGNHIRYYASGIGYYYGDEVESAVRFDPSIEIIGGFRFIRECEHQPFKWIESYYAERQRMKREHDYAEIIIKLGLNSVYGKLAQSKGKNPRYQNLIWAGMITSGTRAMLMNAIASNPSAVFKLSTDAVFSTEKLSLPPGPELGQWKEIELEDLLVLGNGIYHAAKGGEDGDGVSKNRGYVKDPKYFNWDEVRANTHAGLPTVITKHIFMKFGGAYQSKRLDERCAWIDEEQLLTYDIPSEKIFRDGWIWPAENPTPYTTSAPYDIDPESLKVW